MSLYLDTSCLLKLFFPEPESARVAAVVAAERSVIVSELAVLEACVQIHGRRMAGLLTKAAAQRLEAQLESILFMSPFETLPFASAAHAKAVDQVRAGKKGQHCRTLDRLHLGLMEVEQLQRLFTNDDRQAAAARHRGFEVLTLKTEQQPVGPARVKKRAQRQRRGGMP